MYSSSSSGSWNVVMVVVVVVLDIHVAVVTISYSTCFSSRSLVVKPTAVTVIMLVDLFYH